LRAERKTQRRIAREDMLTALPNRRAFHEELAARMASGLQSGAMLSVAMLDLNGFKRINDIWGHAGGDRILCAVGARIRAALHETDFAGRLGGDEFALILNAPPLGSHQTEKALEAFCNRLQQAVSAPVAMPNGQPAHVSLCIGFAASTPGESCIDTLLRQADQALYDAKADHGRQGQFWCVSGDRPAKAEPALDIWALLHAGALVPHFQPVLDLENGKVTKIEALARLRHREGTIPPADFLPLMTLEERNLLFCQMLEAGIAQVMRLEREGSDVGVAINVDGQVLLLERTLPFISEVLTKNGIAPARLVLEILETYEFFSMHAARAQIDAMRALGVRVALDDVGAGHSSLLKLRDLPLDIVKLDRAFAARLTQKPDDLIFIATMQTITTKLGMKLIVEGVEDETVVEALRIVGVRQVQGYAIAPAMDGVTLMQWLCDYRPREFSQTPQSLLGVYALHSEWLRALEFFQQHETALAPLLRSNFFYLPAYAAGPGAGLLAVQKSYETLTRLMQMEAVDLPSILAASLAFHHELIAAMAPRRNTT
jgi:diguanylate cyclase (GGDEF)-like protein